MINSIFHNENLVRKNEYKEHDVLWQLKELRSYRIKDDPFNMVEMLVTIASQCSLPTVKETGFRIQAQWAVTIHKMY